ncbi:hypothetical protein DXG01_015406 [Tephrocybe rancida]|nr:hypothetical protein DXG01_015406 [Tephrocybe rancida]
MEIYLAYILYKNSGAARRLGATAGPGVSISMYIRLILFTFIGSAAMGLAITSLGVSGEGSARDLWNILLVTIPNLGAITFGTQKVRLLVKVTKTTYQKLALTKDILRAWAFWKWRPLGHGDNTVPNREALAASKPDRSVHRRTLLPR